MNRWLSFFEHKQVNPSIKDIWLSLFINLVASLVPFIFIAPLPATLTCVALLIGSLTLHFLKWRIYGPITYAVAIFVILSLRTTLPKGTFSGEFFATVFAVLAIFKSYNLRQYGDGIIYLILTLGVNSAIFLLDSDSSMLVIVWTFSATLWTLGNLLRINLKDFSSPALIASLKSAGYAILYTLPLLLFLFYIFQRFSHSPLYSERSDSVVGISRNLEPGSISNLSESSNIVLRAKLNQNEFPLADLYWRGTTLAKSMGMKWTVGKDIKKIESPAHFSGKKDNCVVEETIYTQRNSLQSIHFAIDEPILESLNGNQPYTVSSQICSQFKNINKFQQSDFSGYLNVDTPVSPKIRALVRRFKSHSKNQNEFLAQIFHYFKGEKFRYSMTPLKLQTGTSNALDEFLFNSKVGFCEHYAAAFATLARLGGVPSRIVVGFHGGTYNRFGNYWVISNKDAHAWTEIWDQSKGWVRFDPTTIVAPKRINEGADNQPENRKKFLSRFHFDDLWLIFDAFFFWIRGLFDNRETLISLDDLKVNPFHVGALIFVILCWFTIRYLNRDYSMAVTKEFKKLSLLLNERTLPRGRHEGFNDYRLRLLEWLDGQKNLRPLSVSIDSVFKKFIKMRYSREGISAEELSKLYDEMNSTQRAIRLKTNFLFLIFKRFS